MNKPMNDNFQTLFRAWRTHRHFSQLDLALEADISQRHLSYLETGRSRPSREMVLKLAEVLDIPLRERNTLLSAAGYSPEYAETNLEAPRMKPVRDAISRILDHHNPYPAVAIDRLWNIVETNAAAENFLQAAQSIIDPANFKAEELGFLRNIAFLTVHPNALRPLITNWQIAGPLFVHRLRRDKAALGNGASSSFYDILLNLGSDALEIPSMEEALLPVIPLDIDMGGTRLQLFSVISTFGTPQDVTTDELRIETFYPMDDATEAFFAA